jgi:hypothetical protein
MDMGIARDAALIAPQLGVRSGPFKLAPPGRPTCSSALVHPWELGSWSNTALSPFDDADLLGKEISDLRWCGRTVQDASGIKSMEVVECSECPIGYKAAFGDSGPLMCREVPTCEKDKSCQDCRLSYLTPGLVGACESCISHGCNADTGVCQCNEF